MQPISHVMRSTDTELQNTKRIATHYCTPFAWMQQFQCTKGLNTLCKTQKHSINKEQKKSPGTRASVTLRAQFEKDFMVKRRRPKPSRKRANFSWPNLRLHEKTQCFVHILAQSNRIHDVAVPCDRPTMTCKKQSDCETSILREALVQPVHRDLRRLSCKTQKELQHTTVHPNAQSVSAHAKHNSTASTKNRKKSPGTTSYTAYISRKKHVKRRRPKPSRKRANFSPQPNLRLPEKTMFVQIL